MKGWVFPKGLPNKNSHGGLGLKLIFGLGLPLMALPSLRQDKLINQMRQYCWTNMISECYTCHTCRKQDCTPGGETDTRPTVAASFTPCADTPGCVMPECCGIVSGELTVLSLTYTATRNTTSGVAVICLNEKSL